MTNPISHTLKEIFGYIGSFELEETQGQLGWRKGERYITGLDGKEQHLVVNLVAIIEETLGKEVKVPKHKICQHEPFCEKCGVPTEHEKFCKECLKK